MDESWIEGGSNRRFGGGWTGSLGAGVGVTEVGMIEARQAFETKNSPSHQNFLLKTILVYRILRD